MPSICLSNEAIARISEYATVYGMSNERAACKAIEQWWADFGSLSVEIARDKGIDKKRKISRDNCVALRPKLVKPVVEAIAV